MSDDLNLPPSSEPSSPTTNRWPGRFLLLAAVCIVGLYFYNTRTVPAAFPWHEDYEKALVAASEKKQLVLLAFHAEWCGVCKQMDRDVFARTDVAQILADWVPVRIDTDKHEPLARQYGIVSLPTFYVLSPQGKALLRFEGGLPADEFIKFLRAGEDAYRPNATQPN